MSTDMGSKSSTEEIRRRFDADVDRFSQIENGQTSTMDARLAMGLIAQAACAATPRIRRILDIGCGAGNNTLKLLSVAGPCDCDLVDLSRPMLDRAMERVSAVNKGVTKTIQGDFRSVSLGPRYDVIIAAAVLHHLRGERDWEDAFAKIFSLTADGGSVWITDLVSHETDAVHDILWQRYGDYLTGLKDEEYRDKVFEYIDREDSPRPVTYQLDFLRRVGFARVEILHKNGPFAAFGAIKQSRQDG